MELTAAQITALKDGRPVTVTPPELGERCVVLRGDVYDRVRGALEPGAEFDARETYPAVLKVLDQTDESPEQYLEYLAEPR
jgi:hypothetical protein